MKLRFNRQEATNALSAVCGVAAVRTPKEILRCVRIEARSDVMLLSATDLELSLRCAVVQVEVEEPGESLVVAETLLRIVRECADEILTIEYEDNVLHVRGVGSHFQIVTQDPADFPAVPVMEGEPEVVIEHGVLRRLVELTAFAAARESTRYAINGVLWEIEDQRLTLAATDGRRLALARGELAAPASPTRGQVIVPGKAVSLLGRLPVEADARVGMKILENQLLLDMGRVVVSTALVEGKFPRYQDVIPTDCTHEIELKTTDFQSALKRSALLTNEESRGVRLSFSDDLLTLSSRAPEQGEATISIPVHYKGGVLEIGFNPVYLLDVLRIVDSEVITLALKEENRPGVIRLGDDFVYVVMPVTLSSA